MYLIIQHSTLNIKRFIILKYKLLFFPIKHRKKEPPFPLKFIRGKGGSMWFVYLGLLPWQMVFMGISPPTLSPLV